MRYPDFRSVLPSKSTESLDYELRGCLERCADGVMRGGQPSGAMVESLLRIAKRTRRT